MPALVTTPATAPLTSLWIAPLNKLGAATTIAPKAAYPGASNAVVVRQPSGYPIKRWNGSVWVTVYQPRY
jgi:hypothetical protein